MRHIFLALFFLGLTSLANAQETGPGYIQLLLGELKLNDETVSITRDDIDFEGAIDSLPYVGGAVQMPIKDDVIGYGWEGGGFISWENNKVDYYASSGSNGGTIGIRVDNAFWSFETFLGFYGSVKPLERLRFYASAGPLFMFAQAESDDIDEEVTVDGSSVQVYQGSKTDSDFVLGWYSRIGADIRLNQQTWVGISVRHMDADVDLSKAAGQFDINGELYLLSITNRY